MFSLALAAVAAVAISRLWKHFGELETAIIRLTARVEELERTHAEQPVRTPPATRPAATPVARPSSAEAPVLAPPRPAPPPMPPPAKPPIPVMPTAETRDAIETRIGTRWLLYIGIAAIVIGVAYFEKLAIDNHWVGDTARVIQGGLLGLALVVGGMRFTRSGYRLYGQLLSGGGIAVLYVVTYAAFNLYHLLPQVAAFAVMSAITLLAAWLSDRQRSQGLALAAVGGGFVTPFLLGSGADAEVALFGYNAILIGGTMLLARRREWPVLNVVSYGFTVLTVAAWASTFYADSKYLTTELFLTLFCAMFLYILRSASDSSHPAARAGSAILWSAPFAYYAASLWILFPHSTALLVYLVLLSLTGVIAGSRTGALVRLAFWIATAWPLLTWSSAAGAGWLVAGLTAWSCAYLLNVAGFLDCVLQRDRALEGPDIVRLHLNTLTAFAGAYLLLQPANLSSIAPIAAGLAILQGVPLGLCWRRQREAAMQFAALAFALLTMAVGIQFDGPWFQAGWVAEGAALIWLGLSGRRTWLRRTGLVHAALGVLMMLEVLFSPRAGQLVLFNDRTALGAFAVALACALTWAHGKLAVPARRLTETSIGLVSAVLLIFAVAASEIVAFWELHTPPPFEPASQLIALGFLIGAVVMGLGLKRQQEWARTMGGAMVAISAFALFSIQIQNTPQTYRAVLNGRAATGVFGIAVLYVLTRLHRDLGKAVRDLSVNIAVLTTAASLLTLSLLTSEINAFWSAPGAGSTVSFAHDALQAMAWAAIGGFLLWRGLSNRHLWVRVIGGVTLTIAIVRVLVVQFEAPEAGYLVVANSRTLAALVLVAVLFGLARLYRTAELADESRYGAPTLRLLAHVIGLTLLTSEITAYWHIRDLRHLSASAAPNGFFAREMMLSMTWAIYATTLVVVGLKKRYAPIRYFAMVVFVITIVKVFAIDMAELDRLYRVASIIGLGILLLVTAFLYQRLRIGDAAETAR